MLSDCHVRISPLVEYLRFQKNRYVVSRRLKRGTGVAANRAGGVPAQACPQRMYVQCFEAEQFAVQPLFEVHQQLECLARLHGTDDADQRRGKSGVIHTRRLKDTV